MRRTPLPLVAALILTGACASGDPMSPNIAALAASSDAASLARDISRPFTGRCTTTITVLPPLVGDPVNLSRLHIDYVCQLTHLGRSTATSEQLVYVTGPTTGFATNTTVITAANGDLLYTTWSGDFTFAGPAVEFAGTQVVTGGTGRFAGATGSSWNSGTASLATGKGQFSVDGTISY